MKLVDSHAHLTDSKYENDLLEVIDAAFDAGVKEIISAGYDFISSEQALKLSKKYPGIYATAGIHPENIAQFEFPLENDFFTKAEKNLEKELKNLEKLAQDSKIVAIGEIGLDYHHIDFLGQQKREQLGENLSGEEVEKIKQLQKSIFEKQLLMAERLQKPVVIHSRDAMGYTLQILQKIRLTKESLLHCYCGSMESAKQLMELGFSFSFGGVATFKNAKNVQEVIKNLPLQRILLETDCPYMSPEPFRGKRNEPKNIVYIADQISRLKGLSIEEVALQTTKNAERLFGLK